MKTVWICKFTGSAFKKNEIPSVVLSWQINGISAPVKVPFFRHGTNSVSRCEYDRSLHLGDEKGIFTFHPLHLNIARTNKKPLLWWPPLVISQVYCSISSVARASGRNVLFPLVVDGWWGWGDAGSIISLLTRRAMGVVGEYTDKNYILYLTVKKGGEKCIKILLLYIVGHRQLRQIDNKYIFFYGKMPPIWITRLNQVIGHLVCMKISGQPCEWLSFHTPRGSTCWMLMSAL